MFALADVVARATRFAVGAEEPPHWTIAAVVGSLVRDADGRRLGAPVELQSLPS
jgi:hypothetical protein